MFLCDAPALFLKIHGHRVPWALGPTISIYIYMLSHAGGGDRPVPCLRHGGGGDRPQNSNHIYIYIFTLSPFAHFTKTTSLLMYVFEGIYSNLVYMHTLSVCIHWLYTGYTLLP